MLKRKAVIVAACLSGLVSVASVSAAEEKNIVRGSVYYSQTSSNLTEGSTTLDAQNMWGLQGSYERMVSHAVGVNFGVAYVDYDLIKIKNQKAKGRN